MKNIKILCYIAFVVFALHSCSTPEERATVVEGADTNTTSTSAPTDSLTSNLQKQRNYPDDSTHLDSYSSNQKMESFRHTPIDTITSKRDSLKQ